MVGNSLTVASPSTSTASGLIPIDRNKFPKLVAYLQRFSQLPYFDEINKVGTETLTNFVKNKMKVNIKLSFDRK